MEIAVTVLAIIIFVGMSTSFLGVARLTLMVNQPGIGRVIFYALTALKFWAILVMLYFLMNTIQPFHFGDISNQERIYIRIFFGVYLVIQTVATNVAVYRWWFRNRIFIGD